LEDDLVNLSGFEEGSIIDEPSQLSNEIYRRTDDGFLIIVKSISLSESVEKSQIVNGLESLINLRHSCIAAPIGFVVSIESVCWEELKIVRSYSEGCSLAEILSVRPMWWTSTVKAKVNVVIVLALRFVHSLGGIHGYSTTNNIVLDSDHEIHIVDFKPVRLEVCEGESERESEEGTKFGRFSREGWTSRMHVCAFALILFEIMFGRPAQDEGFIPTGIPDFVWQILELELYATSKTRYSFHDIFETLKRNDFQIEVGVDSAEVFASVKWIECAEVPEE
jgi:serine/threonine protein kinase